MTPPHILLFVSPAALSAILKSKSDVVLIRTPSHGFIMVAVEGTLGSKSFLMRKTKSFLTDEAH